MTKKKKLIVACLACASILLAGCGAGTNKIIRLIEKNDFSGAYEAYKDTAKKQDDLSDLNEDINEALEDRYSVIISDYANGKIDGEAISYLDKIVTKTGALYSDDYYDFLNDIDEISVSMSYYDLGIESYDNGEYANAVTYLGYVIEADELHYSDAQDKLTAASAKLEEEQKAQELQLESDIHSLVNQGRFDEVKNAINSFQLECSDTDLVQKLLDVVENDVSSAMEDKVSAYFEELDYASAYSYVQGLANTFDFESVSSKYTSLSDEFAEYALTAAEKDAASNNYEGASSIIEMAIQEVGDDNTSLNEAYNEYRKHLPIYLADMDYMSCEGSVSVDSNLIDNTNVTYRHSLWIDGWGQKAYWAEYFTNGNYSRFTGVCGCSYDNRSSSESKYFEVYGDGKLLYTSPTMTSSAIPVNFDIDISGVRVVRIWYPATEGNNKIAALYDGMFLPKSGDTETNAATEAVENTSNSEE